MSNRCTTPRALLVLNGQYGIVHLTEAVSDVEYLIQFALTDTVDAPDKLWADLYTDGEPLLLTPQNTPLILNVPGAYRFIENSPANGTITTATYPSARLVPGDVK